MALYQCPHCGTGYSLDEKHYQKQGYRETCGVCGGDLLVDRDGQVYALETVEAVAGSSLRTWGTAMLLVILVAVSVPIVIYLLEAAPTATGVILLAAGLVLVLIGLGRMLILFRKSRD